MRSFRTYSLIVVELPQQTIREADNQLTQRVKCVLRHRRRTAPMGKLAVVVHDDVEQWFYVFVYPLSFIPLPFYRLLSNSNKYYTNWLGASFFTIPTVEKEFDVTPAQILDLTFFYDFGDCFVGMESNEKGVVVQMTLRLFAEKATDFIQKAVDYGYEYVAKGENVNVRSNTGKLLPDVYDTNVKQYRKATKNGNVYMEVANSKKYANEYEIAIYRAK